ncbi:DNA (cytosine-5)-methyltransferase 1 [Candidatus Electrothrix aarhusensis]|uniref:Cytosine-specific methyltransferase n=1 Tax=Candidatus Electrothrix aarhusensis TaxID=1859131 RepID=A0A444IR39_9BACT|nr:DNA (cytosine-5)-methyltransferase 1 [Candidatus Electrothrix aarhusensis]
MKKTANPTAISLFCGAGGCSYGFQQAGFDILYAADIDKTAVATYEKNFPDTKVEQIDIDKIDFDQLLLDLDLLPKQLDILIGGPPCQGFSTAGSRFWDDPRNHLLKSYVHALNILKPKWFLMENVEGLLTANRGTYITEAAKAFIELGYKIRIEKIYAHEYGIPQRRKRVLIFGNRLGLNFEMPRPTSKVSGKIFKNSENTISDAIADLPAPAKKHGEPTVLPTTHDIIGVKKQEYTVDDHCSPNIEGVQKERICALQPGQTMKDLPEKLQHGSFKKRANRRVADGTPTEKRGGPPSGLKRLRADQPCLTITGAATRELIHPTQNRPLTLRECARIQTFPDSFTFCGSASERVRQIGNAIPPLLAFIFANHIKNQYGFCTKHSSDGELLGAVLTKANAMSLPLPALTNFYCN